MSSQLAAHFQTRQGTLLLALYGLSGVVGLAYQVLWARMLSLQFGVSTSAVVLTVAAFMVGLGAGSLYAVKYLVRVKNPLLILAILEGGIACYALLLPVLMKIISSEVDLWAAQLSLLPWYGSIALAAFGLLLLPTFAMGAGLPLILSAFKGRSAHLGQVYGLNTLGAACGALLPLWLLPALGWVGAIRVVAALGIVVALGLLYAASRRNAPSTPVQDVPVVRPPWPLLLAYAGIGAASLALEMAWTRLFGMVMLRTEYVLALILAAFLFGIALGSLLAPRQYKKIWFAILPVVAGGSALLSLWMLPALSSWIEQAEFSSLFSALLVQGGVLTLLILPVTISLGAWLPLLNSRFEGAGVWLYGANCLGAALGAIVAGVVLVPLIGSAATVVAAAAALLVVGLVWSQSRMAWLALPLFLIAAWPVVKLPSVSVLLPQTQAGSRDLYLYEDAVSMTHVIEQADGQRVLLTDMQRMDASTEPTAVLVQSNQARLPLLLHEHPRSVLFLGLGTGISVAGSLPFPDLKREAVELSQGAIVAAHSWFDPANRGAMRQIRVERDDVRHFLSASQDRYDVIIGDVFHPDMAGTSTLLSVQQFKRAHAHLSENGIFVQWLALNQFDPESLRVIMRSFRRVYPDAQLFVDGMHLAMVGPHHKFGGAQPMWRNLERLSALQQGEATAGENGWTWLGRYWGPLPDSSGSVQDEWAPVIEFRLPRARYAGKLDVASTLHFLLQTRPDMQDAAALLGIGAEGKEAFERAFGATELMMRSWLASAQGATQEAGHLMFSAYQANAKDRWIAYALADSMLSSVAQASAHGLSEQEALQKILHINPRHPEALRALWHLQRQLGDAKAESTRERLLDISPFDREARLAEKTPL